MIRKPIVYNNMKTSIFHSRIENKTLYFITIGQTIFFKNSFARLPKIYHQKPVYFSTDASKLLLDKDYLSVKPCKKELASKIFDGVKPTYTKALTTEHNFNWLNIDNEYLKEMKKRIKILNNNPLLWAYDKKYEEDIFLTLQKICSYLVKTYPSDFKFEKDNKYIKNCLTNKSYSIYTDNPLYTIGCLIPQDVNILLNYKNVDPKLVGSITLYSVGWKVIDRLNYSLEKLHATVPGWNENKRPGAIKVFSDLYKDNSLYFYRTNLFIQVTSNLVITDKNDYNKFLEKRIFFKSLYLRREYQVFTSITPSIVIFTVETYIVPLSSLNLNELKQVYSYFSKLKPSTYGDYHDFNVWGSSLAKYIKRLEEKVSLL